MNDSVTILGVPFSKLTLDETTHHLSAHIQKGQANSLHLITANPEITIVSQYDELLRKIISEADLITPDGVGILMAARRKNEPLVERVTGYDLLLRLLEAGNQQGWSFYFLGTDETTNRHAVDKICQLYPNVKIAGRHHGFFAEVDESSILSEIKHTEPDILIVAMGAPYSDKWIYKHKQDIAHTKVVFGVGGSLDVIAGKVPPTPSIWKKMNLEWLHRLFTAPVAKGQKSRWRRQSALPKFVYRAIIKSSK